MLWLVQSECGWDTDTHTKHDALVGTVFAVEGMLPAEASEVKTDTARGKAERGG